MFYFSINRFLNYQEISNKIHRNLTTFPTGIFVLFFLTIVNSHAQKLYTLSGYIKDSKTGESLIGANVYIPVLQKGTTTNVYGFYSISLPETQYEALYNFLGYTNLTKQINLTANVRMNVELEPQVIEMGEVVIKGEKDDRNVQSSEMSKVEISMESIRKLPVIFGETDVLKTIQLLPGVKNGGEGNTGFYVRGGGPDQNLILLDEAVVYNPGHLFGFFSVFNGDAINNTTLIKGGMPANYGGRLSSVVDISMKEGNDKKYTVDGGIGLIASRLTVQGPIKKEKSSFIISARRTYIDVLVKPFISNSKYAGSGYFFYDMNTKINYRFSDKDRLFLSGYFGRDVFRFQGGGARSFSTYIPWGNATTTLRWNHLFTDKLFMNTSVIYNDYNFNIESGFENFKLKLMSGIKDINLKWNSEYFHRVNHRIIFGADYIYHTFTPNSASVQGDDNVEFNNKNIRKKYAHEGALYVSSDYDLTEKLKFTTGLRFSEFQQVGPYILTSYDDKGFIKDTIHQYKSLEKVKNYSGLEPRISIRYILYKTSSLKASWTINQQYIHLVSNSSTTLPTDIWVPSTVNVKPQSGSQYALGYFQNFREDMFEFSIETYYKLMENQIEFKDGYSPDLNTEIERNFVFGTGKSYGLELFLKKRLGKLQGWIGYTLSRTSRHFDLLKDVNFLARYDRLHDGSLVLSYQLTKRWSLGGVFVYGTGSNITLPYNSYMISGNMVNDYGPRNGYRMESYHRLDLSVTLQGKETKKFNSSWVFSCYNVYNRKNPYIYYVDPEGDALEGTLDIKAYKVYIFPILPSVTWNFKF